MTPIRPAIPVTSVALALPSYTLSLTATAETVKDFWLIVSDPVAVCCSPPLPVPVIVKLKVPAGEENDVERVRGVCSVEVTVPVRDVGENDAVTPAGGVPVHERAKFTVLLPFPWNNAATS